jgi:hypothetical protein
MTKREDQADREEDLAATSESLQADAERVSQIEEEKQDLDVGDPRLTALSHEAERVARDIEKKSRIERELAADGDGAGERRDRPN